MIKYLVFVALLTAVRVYSQPSFPGAEGFGSNATGGRGGKVIYVTNLNASGPGSLNEALATPGKKYILFKVSGIIDAVADIRNGDCTIAGQTSPGGIIVRGILVDDIFDPTGKADNIIIRHLRSRPSTEIVRPGTNILDDGLRLDGASNVMIDHVSIANATDEAVQISRSKNISIQYSTFSETIGDHYQLGGMLINYTEPTHPLDNLSIHKNAWNRIGGRYPEISCESPTARGHVLNMELSYNLFWDIQSPILYNSNIDPAADPPIDSFFVRMNISFNRAVSDTTYPYGLFTHNFLEFEKNELYLNDSRLQMYIRLPGSPQGYSDVDLFYCCNDFKNMNNRPNRDSGKAFLASNRFDFPIISVPSTGPSPRQIILSQGGAYPRDSMDRRLLKSILIGGLDTTAVDGVDHYHDAFILDYSPNDPPPAPLDDDSDGMPNWWEIYHGSDPLVPNHNDQDIAERYNIMPPYPNLELYLNALSDSIIFDTTTTLGEPKNSVRDNNTSNKTTNVYTEGRLLIIEPAADEQMSLVMCDVSGREVLRHSFRGALSLQLKENIAAGVYMIKLDKRIPETFKIIIQ